MDITFDLTTLPGCEKVYLPIPPNLPGVVIFVHGVNSDGEWYEACERGLCEGLNGRLARRDAQMAYCGPKAGQMTPAQYTPELTADGFIQPLRDDKKFIKPDPFYSSVIRFRWGYKADKEAVKQYGANVWLNENNYWGGGPFANGCSSVPDLWSPGLNDRLFLWINAQHLNPVPGRDVFNCPPRAYYVHAALRLAKLIKSVRDKQADCPITVVCHSQGNMVGIGAAFLADTIGVQADNFILCNPPLSLVPDNMMESWTQRSTQDANGSWGRQSAQARYSTLKHFFDLLRARAGLEQAEAKVNELMANACPRDGSQGYTAGADRRAHGLNGSTYGRVTLYCNPHDQVISASTVQGIGWRGLSADEIASTGGQGVFTQRVFAQGYAVGQAPGQRYDYWADRWNKGQKGFWYPPSPAAKFSLKQGLESAGWLAKLGTVVTAPLLSAVDLLGMPVNAEPPAPKKGGWAIPIDAPALPEAITPKSQRYGQSSDQFDEAIDPAGNARDAHKPASVKRADDPYDSHTGTKDAPMGDEASEAQLRYEDRARLRMKARRADMADKDGKVEGEDSPDGGNPEYQSWRNEQIGEFLKQAMDQNATDHSTIVTNAMHAAKVMAYDVAIGACTLSSAQWHELRVEADWRYAKVLADKGHPHGYLSEYFRSGLMNNKPVDEWARTGEAAMPAKVVDERTIKTRTGGESR
jgi:pimeloyl-ACP methyl ester carboxylesterase